MKGEQGEARARARAKDNVKGGARELTSSPRIPTSWGREEEAMMETKWEEGGREGGVGGKWWESGVMGRREGG